LKVSAQWEERFEHLDMGIGSLLIDKTPPSALLGSSVFIDAYVELAAVSVGKGRSRYGQFGMANVNRFEIAEVALLK
jgi:hypothetical protein